MPEIELTGPDSARGIWAMYDYVTWGRDQGLKGYGHCHETSPLRRRVRLADALRARARRMRAHEPCSAR